MTPNQRPILPAPSASSAEAIPARQDHKKDASLVRKRTAINTACNQCRSRRSKCDGARPRCLPCKTKGTHCEYDLDVSLGQTRVAALKSRMEALTKDNRSMLEALLYLKTQPAEEAIKFLGQLRSGAGLEPLKNLGQTQEQSAAVSTVDLKGVLLENSKTPDTASPVATDSLESVSTTHQTPATRPEKIRSAIGAPKSLEFARVSTIRTAVHAFIHCSGLLFHIVSQDQVDIVLKGFLGAKLDDETLVVDLLKETTSLQLKASICELFAIAAVGVLYMRGEEPNGHVAPGLADGFYVISKNHLNNAIEAGPLHATKACTMLAMYNIALQATVALTYVDIGLNLWRMHANQQSEPSPGIPEESWVDYKMTWRTLELLHGWLSEALGFVPESNVTKLSSEIDEAEDFPSEEAVQLKMAMIAVKKGIILRTIGEQPSNPTIRMLRDDLRSFHEDMPSGMTLNHLTLSSGIPSDLRRIVFYMHLFYMSALMLLYRLILRHTDGVDYLTSAHVCPHEAQKAAGEGLLAAKTAARILHLLLTEGSVVRICWLSIFTAYTSCLIILYGTVQKILYGYPQSYWTGDLPTASKCIDVLKYCGEVDPLASRLQQVVQVYQDTLDARSAEHELGTDSPSVDRFDLEIPASCLFVLPPGNSDMHMVSRELLQLIRRPFQAAGLRRPGIALLESKPKIGVSLINAEETVMGAHLEWSWEISHHFKGQKSNETGDLGDDSTVTRDMLSQLGSGKLFKSRKASG